MTSRALVVLAALFAGAAFARADTLVLKDGGRLEGSILETVREDGLTYYRLRLAIGTTKVETSQVLEIVRAPTPLEEYRKRRDALQEGDAAGFLALAKFCKEQHLYPEMQKTYREIVAFAPDQPDARAALGYVRKDDRWVTESQSRQEDGFVCYEGAWITPAALRSLLEERQEGVALEAKRRETDMARRKAAAEKALAEKKPGVTLPPEPAKVKKPDDPNAFNPGTILRPGQNRTPPLNNTYSIG
ncbi:MAG: hypothetical protein AAB215_09265, partial [Planctomycetota bacterium]